MALREGSQSVFSGLPDLQPKESESDDLQYKSRDMEEASAAKRDGDNFLTFTLNMKKLACLIVFQNFVANMWVAGTCKREVESPQACRSRFDPRLLLGR